MKNIINIAVLYLFLLNTLASQSDQKIELTNEKITFSIISSNYWKGNTLFSKLRKNLVRVEDFNYQLKDFEYEELVNLIKGLDSENTDWACNLVLYQLANKDALLLFNLSIPYINSKSHFFESETELIQMWREFYKKEDKEYWLNWLDSNYSLNRA